MTSSHSDDPIVEPASFPVVEPPERQPRPAWTMIGLGGLAGRGRSIAAAIALAMLVAGVSLVLMQPAASGSSLNLPPPVSTAVSSLNPVNDPLPPLVIDAPSTSPSSSAPLPEPSAGSSPAPGATSQPSARPTAKAGSSPTARPTPSPTARPTPSPTPRPTPIPTPAPTQTPTPTPSATPAPCLPTLC